VTERTTAEFFGTTVGSNWFVYGTQFKKRVAEFYFICAYFEKREIRFSYAECKVEAGDRAVRTVARNLFDYNRVSRVLSARLILRINRKMQPTNLYS
jgi:hypothetical protein